MKQGQKTLLVVLGGVALCGQTSPTAAVSADNPYSPIVSRNVFALKPPPPPPEPAAPVKAPPPKLTLTGIFTLLGNKRALMKGTFSSKPGDPAKEQFLTLAEGQRDGDIEVVSIDEKKGVVVVDDFGTTVNLTFESATAKPGPAPPGLPVATIPASLDRGAIPMPARLSRISIPTPPPAPAPTPPPTAQAAPAAPVAPAVPAAALYPAVNFTPPASTEEQIITMEVLRAQHADDPEFPPFPPTILTPGYDEETATVKPPAPAEEPPAAPPPAAPAPPVFSPFPTRPGMPPGAPPGPY